MYLQNVFFTIIMWFAKNGKIGGTFLIVIFNINVLYKINFDLDNT